MFIMSNAKSSLIVALKEPEETVLQLTDDLSLPALIVHQIKFFKFIILYRIESEIKENLSDKKNVTISKFRKKVLQSQLNTIDILLQITKLFETFVVLANQITSIHKIRVNFDESLSIRCSEICHIADFCEQLFHMGAHVWFTNREIVLKSYHLYKSIFKYILRILIAITVWIYKS